MSFKIAVIGCGWVSEACHGPAYLEYTRTHPNTTLTACCDTDPQRAEAFRSRFGFQSAYTNYSEMLEKEHPDAVALNVPPQLACTIGCDIMRRGFPLLCEKPPGLSLEEIDRLIETAHSNGIINQVAFNRRFMPLAVELKQRLSGKNIHHIEAQQSRVQRTDANFATTAVHVIDQIRYLLDADYAQCTFSYQDLPGLGPGVANFLLDGALRNGTTAHLAIFPAAGLNIERITVYALNHTFFLQANNGPDVPGRLAHFHNGALLESIDAATFTGRGEEYFLNGFFQEDAAFFDAVQLGRQPVHDFQSCRQSVEMMQRMMERRPILA